MSAPRDGNMSPKYYASQRLDSFSVDGKASTTGQDNVLSSNRHFDHLAVNLTLSTVLLPAGVKDAGNTLHLSNRAVTNARGPVPKLKARVHLFSIADREVAAGIQWSEYLDLLFVNNYESDPSLSWQYYGATSGFLRRFPGR